MHPELHQDGAFGGQHLLELADLAVGTLPLLRRRELLDALDEYAAVPAAVEHDHPAPPRQLRPEPPQKVVALLVVRRCGELRDPYVSRVERSHQPLDAAALAGRVPAFEQNTQR